MKIRLPYFFLALLYGYFFFFGSVQAAIYTEDFINHPTDLVSTLPSQHQAEISFKGLYHHKSAGQGSTYNLGGSVAELLEVDSKIAGGATQAFFNPVVGAAENRAIRLRSNTASFSARANDAEELIIPDSRTTSLGANLYRKQMASFLDIFL